MANGSGRVTSSNQPETPPWPPTLPLKPSLYGLVLKRETRAEVRRALAGTGANYYGESADGSSLNARQLDIMLAIAGGAPVDADDPGVQV